MPSRSQSVIMCNITIYTGLSISKCIRTVIRRHISGKSATQFKLVFFSQFKDRRVSEGEDIRV